MNMMPIHPGEILKEEILVNKGITQTKLAEEIGIPLTTVRAICQGRRDIDADIALRLGIYFNTSFEFWLNLQQHYDLRICQKEEKTLRKQISPLVYQDKYLKPKSPLKKHL